MDYLLGIGLTIVFGYITGRLIQLLKVPSVAGYVIVGLLIGSSCMNIIGPDFIDHTTVIGDIALGFIAFTIGGELIMATLKKIGLRVFVIAFFEAFLAFTLVLGAMLLMHQSMATALLLGAVAAATAPAATLMVINELQADGPLTSTLLAVVAIDDAICLMIYAIASSSAKILVSNGGQANWTEALLAPFIEIGGSLLAGILLGVLLALLLKFSRDNTEILAVVIAAILAATGIANMLGLSALLTNMAMGIMVSNFSSKQRKAFHSLESVSSPIYIAFFVIAGSRLQLNMLLSVGAIGLVYTLARAAGKIFGASFGAVVTGAHENVKKYVGFGLISQIGVAVGLALDISNEFKGTYIGSIIITILLSTTIITEIVGPLMTKMVLYKSKEVPGCDALVEKTATVAKTVNNKNLDYHIA